MLNQKDVIQKIYVDLANDPAWITEYEKDPEAMLDRYGIEEQNRERLRAMLDLLI
jgi:hypothetical protein